MVDAEYRLSLQLVSSSRFRLKAAYQRNMIIANVVVALGVAAIVALFSQIEGGGVTRSATDNSPSISLPGQSISPATMAVGAGGSRPASGHFMGFGTRFRIIPNQPSVSVAHASLANALPPAPVDFPTGVPIASGSVSGFGMGCDTLYDHGLPEREPLWAIRAADYSLDYGELPIRLAEVKPDRPARVKFLTRMRVPRDAKEIDFCVRVAFDITAAGRLDNFEVVEETPPDIGLASALLHQIQECAVWPAEVRGQKVTTRVTVTRVSGRGYADLRVRCTGNVAVVD